MPAKRKVPPRRTATKRKAGVTQKEVRRRPAGRVTAKDVVRPSKAEILNPECEGARKVLMIYTGGTMGMQDMGTGSLGPVPGALLRRLRSLEELRQSRMPKCYFLEFSPILDSADMCPSDWCTIAGVIEEAYYEYDGFVVIHGTDTMAYTASALSFMLEQLSKPVVLTGSQLPFFEPLSDARQNLLGATVFAGLADLCEVCIFFCGQLLRGNRTNKANASSLMAFESPNYPPLAELGADAQIFRKRLREPPKGRFRVHRIHVTEIMVVWVIPGFSDSVFDTITHSKSLRGVVLLLYGCGNAPAKKEGFLRCLRQLVKHGVTVLACSQCRRGSVSLEKYEVGKAFRDAGVISARDMTTEAAVTKLAYLLSKGLTPEQCRKAIGDDLRGEVSTEVTTFTIEEPTSGLSSVL